MRTCTQVLSYNNFFRTSCMLQMENSCKLHSNHHLQASLQSSLASITTFSQNKYVKRESSCEQNQLACGAQFKFKNQTRMTDSIDAEHEGLRIPTQYGLDIPCNDFYCKTKFSKYKAPVKEAQLLLHHYRLNSNFDVLFSNKSSHSLNIHIWSYSS